MQNLERNNNSKQDTQKKNCTLYSTCSTGYEDMPRLVKGISNNIHSCNQEKMLDVIRARYKIIRVSTYELVICGSYKMVQDDNFQTCQIPLIM